MRSLGTHKEKGRIALWLRCWTRTQNTFVKFPSLPLTPWMTLVKSCNLSLTQLHSGCDNPSLTGRNSFISMFYSDGSHQVPKWITLDRWVWKFCPRWLAEIIQWFSDLTSETMTKPEMEPRTSNSQSSVLAIGKPSFEYKSIYGTYMATLILDTTVKTAGIWEVLLTLILYECYSNASWLGSHSGHFPPS